MLVANSASSENVTSSLLLIVIALAFPLSVILGVLPPPLTVVNVNEPKPFVVKTYPLVPSAPTSVNPNKVVLPPLEGVDQLKTPLPFVVKTWLEEPSSLGNVNV